MYGFDEPVHIVLWSKATKANIVNSEQANMSFKSTEFSAQDHKHLLIACFPKSGSSFLALILASLPGFQRVSLIPDYGRREAELSLNHLVVADRNFPRFVAKHHLRFSHETKRLIESFSLQPIVLVRNIYDVVVSIRDQIKREAVVMAQAYVPPEAPRWESQRIEQFVVDMIIPWYFNFYASWADCSNRLELTYEELIIDPQATVRRIRDKLQIQATDAQVSAAVEAAESDRMSSRFNIGLSGRGKELGPGVVSKIQEITSYYAFIDLSSIGLPQQRKAVQDQQNGKGLSTGGCDDHSFKTQTPLTDAAPVIVY